MLKLHQRPERLRELRSLVSWLHTVVKNALTDQVRRLARRRNRGVLSLSSTVGDDLSTGADLIPSNEDDPHDRAYQQEVLSDIAEFLQSLPKDRAEVFRLYRRGLSHKEIASETNLPMHTVNNIISRTKELLWKRLEKWGLAR